MHTSFNIFKRNITIFHKIKSGSQYLIACGGYPDLVRDSFTEIAFSTVLNLEICACVVEMNVFCGFNCNNRCVYIYSMADYS